MLAYLLKAAQLHSAIKLTHGGLLASGAVINKVLKDTVYLKNTIYMVDKDGVHCPKKPVLHGMKLRGVA